MVKVWCVKIKTVKLFFFQHKTKRLQELLAKEDAKYMAKIQLFREYFIVSMTIKQLHAISFSRAGIESLAMANAKAVHAMIKPQVPMGQKEVSVFFVKT